MDAAANFFPVLQHKPSPVVDARQDLIDAFAFIPPPPFYSWGFVEFTGSIVAGAAACSSLSFVLQQGQTKTDSNERGSEVQHYSACKPPSNLNHSRNTHYLPLLVDVQYSFRHNLSHMYRAFPEVNRYPLFKIKFQISVFKENYFTKNSILKPCFSPSSLCKVLDSRWHRVHKFSYLGHRNFLLLLLDVLKDNFFFGSL